jgi:hypothetical protein
MSAPIWDSGPVRACLCAKYCNRCGGVGRSVELYRCENAERPEPDIIVLCFRCLSQLTDLRICVAR